MALQAATPSMRAIPAAILVPSLMVPLTWASLASVVGSTAGGEWDGYTINVATAGVYAPTALVGSSYAGGTFHLEFGPVGQVGGTGVVTSGEFTFPNTGSFTTFQPVTTAGVSLPAGLLWMRLVLDSQYPCMFDDFTLTPAPVLASIAVSPNPVTLNTGGTQQFTAVANDQNGHPLSPQPTIAWTCTGVGTITSAGLYSAGTTAGTATVTAKSGTVSGNAAVTVNPSSSPATLSLTAAATGANKVTLYWNGISGASGYDIYRSTVSGGPYTQIASNVSTADPGPGMTSAFMYSDAAGLTMGIEYFYVIRAVQSSTETIQSNEDSAIPDGSAIPWDMGSAAQIIAAVNTTLTPVIDPDTDPDTGDQSPAVLGLLTVCGPDGVLYQGNYSDGSPADTYPPSASYTDDDSGVIAYTDGTYASAPSESDAPDTTQSSASALPTDEWNSWLNPNTFVLNDLFDYDGNYSGIWRKIESIHGARRIVGICGLPDLIDPTSVRLATFGLPASTGKTGTYSDAGDIYFGGSVASLDGSGSHELDAGLQAVPNTGASTWVAGWVPVINPGTRKNNHGNPVGNLEKAIMTGLALKGPDRNIASHGNLAGYKVYAIHEAKMEFLTPRVSGVADQQVVLRIGRTGGIAGGDVRVAPVLLNPNSRTLYLGPSVSYPAATLYYYANGWRKLAARGGNDFKIKRTNSIAQTLHDPTPQPKFPNGANVGYPEANGPAETASKSFLLDGSFIKGAYWGDSTDTTGVRIDLGGGYQSWGNTSSQGYESGAYPNSKDGGLGYVTWTNHSAFSYEDNINLKASTSLP